MTQEVEMPDFVCENCKSTFRPKLGGWNAKYCQKSCKTAARWSNGKTRPSLVGKTTYYSQIIKSDPEKLAIHRARANQTRKSTRQWLAAYKMERGCFDCGYKSHPAALQLDHMGKKTAEISLIRTSVKRLQREIDSGECVVRCANCHSIKTWAEKNGLPNPNGLLDYHVDRAL